MKNVIKKVIMLIIMLVLVNSISYANSSLVKTNVEQDNINNEDKLEVNVNITELKNVDKGINAYTGTLNFNTNELKFLEIKGTEKWNMPTYNEKLIDNGKIKVVATSNEFINEECKIFTVIFEKKENKQKYNLEFTEFEVAAKIGNETIKVTEKNNEVNITNKAEESITEEKNTNIGIIIVLISIVGLMVIGILCIGFGMYQKNKGGR